jgi:hypothetical protein
MAALSPANRHFGLGLVLLLAHYSAPAFATELVGRVVDAVNARIFAGAVIDVRDNGQTPRSATSDRNGFFRLPGLAPDAYILDVSLPDGHGFAARLVLLPDRRTQLIELDYSRIALPEDHDEY